MKAALYFILIILCLKADAKNYYFSAITGSDARSSTTAQNPATPWKTISKYNSFAFSYGDSALFRSGETFPGKIIISSSGTYIGSYGPGENAIISGFKLLSGWVNIGGNIWEASCTDCKANLNTVLINDSLMPVGHTEWKNFQSHSGISSITDTNLTGSWQGGEVVIRKARWILDRNKITTHLGTTIIFNPASPYEPENGSQYFIQNHPATLDQDGEWFLDVSTKKIKVYSQKIPENIQVGVVDTVMACISRKDVFIENIQFQGANISTVQINASQRITIKDCNFLYGGTDGITGVDADFTAIINCTFTKIFNNSINYLWSCDHSLISGNLISNTAMVPGMGKSSDLQYEGILINGSHNLVIDNRIYNIGYTAIAYNNQDSIKIFRNLIDGFCLIKTDGGAIYSWTGNSNSQISFGRLIKGNVIRNGTNSGANAIYMDDNVSQVEIDSNIISNCNVGMLLHNVHQIIVTHNILFNNQKHLVIIQDHPSVFIRDLLIKNNSFFSSGGQLAMWVQTKEPNISLFGSIDSNYYSFPGEKNIFKIETSTGTNSYKLTYHD